jgi:hypothetical protein
MTQTTLDVVLAQAQQLSPLDKVRLVEQIMTALEQELQPVHSGQPRRSLLGIWSGAGVSADEIDESRREMWGDFPREDI